MMVKNLYIRLVTITIVLLAGLFFVPPPAVLATAVDRMALPNLEVRPGETIEAQITLEGTGAEESSGYWDIFYKAVAGDDERMDITSWLTISPEEYTITQGQTITFTVRVKIPANAEPGLWGATTEEAWQSGHSAERRTYLIFKDTPTGGNVYSGLLLPISVQVLANTSPPAQAGETSPLAPALEYITDNIIVVVFGAIIIILLTVLIVRTGARKAS